MTEEEWLNRTNPSTMLKHLRGKATNRKLQLFKLACLRRIWQLVPDDLSRTVVEAVDQFLDGRASHQDWVAVHEQFIDKLRWGQLLEGANSAVEALAACGTDMVESAIETAAASADAMADASVWPLLQEAADRYTHIFQEEGWNNECAAQAALLRHLLGNPFRPYPVPPSWPSAVVKLAESMYAAEDCSFALRDALLEGGHPELAEHFQKEQWHPKGCWVVDMILGKS
jgi:hypothetical protein